MPYVLQTEFGIPTARVGMVFGAVAVAATVGGTLLLPYLVDRLQGRLGAAIISRLSAASALLAVAAIGTASAVSTLPVFLGVTGLGLMLLTGAANNILVAFQTLVPAHMRATFTASCLLSITLLGLGVGPPAFAAIRALAPGAQDHAALILCLAAALPAALLLEFASGQLARAQPNQGEKIDDKL
jgi:MFS family permease